MLGFFSLDISTFSLYVLVHSFSFFYSIPLDEWTTTFYPSCWTSELLLVVSALPLSSKLAILACSVKVEPATFHVFLLPIGTEALSGKGPGESSQERRALLPGPRCSRVRSLQPMWLCEHPASVGYEKKCNVRSHWL